MAFPWAVFSHAPFIQQTNRRWPGCVHKRPNHYLKGEVPAPDDQLVFPLTQHIQTRAGNPIMPFGFNALFGCSSQRKYIDLIYEKATKYANWDPPREIRVRP